MSTTPVTAAELTELDARRPAPTPIEKVQAEFIAEISRNGIEAALNWIGEWYIKAAKARLDMDLAATPAFEHELFLTKEMLRMGQGAASYTTGIGPSEVFRARLAACAVALEHASQRHIIELRRQAQRAYLAEANSQQAAGAAA